MCGILGHLSIGEVTDGAQRFDRAMAAIRHRGPDAESSLPYLKDALRARLGHTRLSIIDLSDDGKQPMTTADGRYSIAFNGEIYNYIELRAKLEATGHVFRSRSDTEVLLHGWAERGLELVPELDGMFAFAVLDRTAGTLTCVRDAFGVKPFYYTEAPGGFSFASETGALLELHPERRVLDVQAAYEYLCWGGYDDGRRTFYRGIQRLEPGHMLTVDLDTLRPRAAVRWWWPAIEERRISFEEAAEGIRSRFLDSVRLQLRSDVPIGISLSGGLDSSAVACAVRHLEPDMPIHTFSYRASDKALDEGGWCRIVNEHIRAIPHETSEPWAIGTLDEVIRRQGEPFGSTSIVAGYEVSRLAKSHGIKVLLEGQGADEMLAGYHGYPEARLRSDFERWRFLPAARFIKEWSSWPGRSVPMLLQALGISMTPVALRSLLLKVGGYDPAPEWLDRRRFASMGGVVGGDSLFPGYGPEGRGRRLAERLREAMTVTGLPRLLRHSDRNTMAWSIEGRVPFCSTVLAGFALSLPDAHQLSASGETKHVFRRAMRGLVPDRILDRRDKIGYVAPELKVLRAHRAEIDGWLGCLDEVAMIDGPAARKQFADIVDGRRRFSNSAWRIANFARWVMLQGGGARLL